jgi:uncharacterized protein
MIKFITNVPACFISEIKSIVITDIHIGIEYELYKSGIIIPLQTEKFLNTIKKIINSTNAKLLIILGDLKYKVPGISIKELKEIPKFLENLANYVKIILCKGNHDDNLEAIIPKGVKFYGSGGFKIKKYGFFHGHAWPNKKLMECEYLFMGHLQPAIQLKDKFNHKFVEQVWIKCKLNKEFVKERYKIDKVGKLNLIIVPSFNKMSGYFILNSENIKNLENPLINSKCLNILEAKIYSLDGNYFGTLSEFIK